MATIKIDQLFKFVNKYTIYSDKRNEIKWTQNSLFFYDKLFKLFDIGRVLGISISKSHDEKSFETKELNF